VNHTALTRARSFWVRFLVSAASLAALSAPAFAQSVLNGGFETNGGNGEVDGGRLGSTTVAN
jgi:hypothetical protein